MDVSCIRLRNVSATPSDKIAQDIMFHSANIKYSLKPLVCLWFVIPLKYYVSVRHYFGIAKPRTEHLYVKYWQ